MSGTNRRYLVFIFALLMILWVLPSCSERVPDIDDNGPGELTTGILRVDFRLPVFTSLPEKYIHRSNLCLGYTLDSLSRKLFLDCANVSDGQLSYDFALPPGNYYYQAAITCSAPGDSCTWGGFPGGRMGEKWTVNRVKIEIGKTTISSPTFQ